MSGEPHTQAGPPYNWSRRPDPAPGRPGPDVVRLSGDVVNHPAHYTQGKVECIDAIESAVVGKPPDEAICVANAIKYLWRYEEKEPVRSLESAEWYLKRLIGKVKERSRAASRVSGCDGGLAADGGTEEPLSILTTTSPGGGL